MSHLLVNTYHGHLVFMSPSLASFTISRTGGGEGPGTTPPLPTHTQLYTGSVALYFKYNLHKFHVTMTSPPYELKVSVHTVLAAKLCMCSLLPRPHVPLTLFLGRGLCLGMRLSCADTWTVMWHAHQWQNDQVVTFGSQTYNRNTHPLWLQVGGLLGVLCPLTKWSFAKFRTTDSAQLIMHAYLMIPVTPAWLGSSLFLGNQANDHDGHLYFEIFTIPTLLYILLLHWAILWIKCAWWDRISL